MKNIFSDERVILTLDATGNEFVFSALKAGKDMTDSIVLEPNLDSLTSCIDTIIKGFSDLQRTLSERPDAISFAFPGPADFPRGIIGKLANIPGFRRDTPLARIIESTFNIPVFINNDADLYTYGEAIGGLLPKVNKDLESVDNPKRFKKLVGVTIGNGFGSGMTADDTLYIGDNSHGFELAYFRGYHNPAYSIEDEVSKRGLIRFYNEASGNDEPIKARDVYKIAKGELDGNKDAALEAFKKIGISLAEVMVQLAGLFDCLIVIGGEIAYIKDLIIPHIIDQMNIDLDTADGGTFKRLRQEVFYLDDHDLYNEFIMGNIKEIPGNMMHDTVVYDSMKRVGFTFSQMGTRNATALGAYAFAIEKLNQSDEK